MKLQSRRRTFSLTEGISVCGPAGGYCDRDGDCRACPRLAGVTMIWVCSFCEVGRHAWEGAKRDVAVPGAYSSGECPRCGHDRMLLIGCAHA